MSVLLDTHVLLWWIEGDPRLSATAQRMIAEANDVYVSAASAWEITIKVGLGKLSIAQKVDVYLQQHLQVNAFRPLAVTLTHATAVGDLPPLHRDPFDRLLVAQAQAEGLLLLSADELVARYGDFVVW